jgi:hypothetical protein
MTLANRIYLVLATLAFAIPWQFAPFALVLVVRLAWCECQFMRADYHFSLRWARSLRLLGPTLHHAPKFPLSLPQWFLFRVNL